MSDSVVLSTSASTTTPRGRYLIVTQPAEVRVSRRQITKEVSRVLKVSRCRRFNHQVVIVQVETAESAKWFCLQHNGRLEVSGWQLRVDTTETLDRVWEVEEGPSPKREGSRPPSVYVADLRDIFNEYQELSNYGRVVVVEDGSLFYEDPVPPPVLPASSEGLRLAPPYHILPNTPFFRSARIIPPPTYSNDGLPTLQRITNRYLASMQIFEEREELGYQQYYEQQTTIQADEETHCHSSANALRIALGWTPQQTRRN